MEDRVIHFEWRNRPEHVFIDGREFKFKSQMEYKWAQYLQRLLELGAIDFWGYETRTFQFKERHRIKRQYTPDFEVREDIGHGLKQTVFHETKTSLRQKDILRFKLMAADYPDEVMVLVLNAGSNKSRQIILKENAMKYINRIVYAQPIFRKLGIR